MAEAPENGGWQITIRRSLIGNLVILVAVLTGSIFLTTIFTANRVRQVNSEILISRALENADGDLRTFFGPVRRSLRVLRRLIGSGVLDPDDPAGLNRYLIPLTEEIPQISSINLGDGEGRNYMLLRLPDRWRNRVVAAEEEGGAHHFQEWGDETHLLREWKVADPPDGERYDARERPWFRVASSAAAEHEPDAAVPEEIYWTEAYPFFTTGEPGITAMVHATTLEGRRIVIAIDVLLADLSDFTQDVQVGENGFALVIDEERRLIGLPGIPELEEPDARARAILKRPRDLASPVLLEGARAIDARGGGLSGVFSFESGGQRHWAEVHPHKLGPNRTVLTAVVVPEADLVGPIHELRLILGAIFLVAFVLSGVMALVLAGRYSAPLIALARNSRRIGSLDLDDLRPVSSHLSEVQQLAGAQERMRSTLESFSRYVPVDVVRELVRRGEAARIGGERREVTSLFTDIENFTSIAERLPPETTTAHLAEYFDAMLGIIQGDGFGEVTQLNGDGVVAFWGAPVVDDEHERHAVDAVLRCRERLRVLNEEWAQREMPRLPTRFGLASGPVVVGNVGSESRLVYTAIGDTINLASRLEGINRFYGTFVLASERVRVAAGDGFVWRRVDSVRVKGKAHAVDVFELLGRAGEVDTAALDFAERYELALSLYQSRRFGEASEDLSVLERERPDDLSVSRLRQMAVRHTAMPPSEDWDGVSEFFEK